MSVDELSWNLSTMVERIVVRIYLYLAVRNLQFSGKVVDQYAFRPTGSTTAALIALFQQLSNILQNNEYVMLVSMYFSRAFDTIAH